jgi:hypothetical protein
MSRELRLFGRAPNLGSSRISGAATSTIRSESASESWRWTPLARPGRRPAGIGSRNVFVKVVALRSLPDLGHLAKTAILYGAGLRVLGRHIDFEARNRVVLVRAQDAVIVVGALVRAICGEGMRSNCLFALPGERTAHARPTAGGCEGSDRSVCSPVAWNWSCSVERGNGLRGRLL